LLACQPEKFSFRKNNLFSHPLITTLKNLKGNVRACVFTEPLWGIPFNLYGPYVSVYMLALGLNDAQVGLIVTISLVLQIFTSLMGGVVTDKLGRRKTTFIFDTISWSIPCLIWAVAQNFNYFVVAAVINSLWRMTMTSWTCLLVEDADQAQLVDIYSWIYISGLVAAFFAPLAGVLIHIFSLVPTMRAIFLLAFVMMTVKFYVLNRYSTETQRGLVRMKESVNQNLFSLVKEYQGVLKQILKTPQTLYTIGIMLVITTCSTINNTFWSIIVTKKILIPAQDIAIYPFVRSAIMLVFFFVVMPRIRNLNFKNPMLIGFCGFILSQVILISVPEKNYLLLLGSTFLEACAMATVNPLVDRMIVLTIDEKERARIMALLYVIVIMFTSPFGWIGGMLSELNRILPFVLNIALFTIGGILTFQAARYAAQKARQAEILPPARAAIEN
jgi:Na+/melibiose symporter-like transporter